MARHPLRALRRSLTRNNQPAQPVHFHNGPQGQPEVCFEQHCRRPRLDAC